MKRFVEGSERMQGALFPDRLEDFVGEDNAMRVVDAFIRALDLVHLGFAGAVPAATTPQTVRSRPQVLPLRPAIAWR